MKNRWGCRLILLLGTCVAASQAAEAVAAEPREIVDLSTGWKFQIDVRDQGEQRALV